MKGRFAPLLTVGLLLCACAHGAGRSGGTIPAGRLLISDSGTELRAIDSATGQVAFSVPGAIALPDWSKLYATTAEGNTTILRTIDGRTGSTLSTVAAPAGFSPSVVSADGRLVALLPAGLRMTGAMPAGRASTRITVVDPSGRMTNRASFRLAGNYLPDAFSSDDKSLFVLDYSPALAPTKYQVARLSLATGRVSPTYGAVKGPVEKMSGERVMRVLSPDRRTLYTLYTNQDPTYSGSWGTGEVAFVHTLSLSSGQAICVDLPSGFAPGPPSSKTLAVSPDGTRLYAVDTSAGLVSVIDTAKRKVLETKHVGLFGSGAASAQVVGARLYVALGSEVTVLGTEELDRTARWNVPGPVSGLAQRDGMLYLSAPDRVTMMDAASGDQLGSLRVPAMQALDYVESTG